LAWAAAEVIPLSLAEVVIAKGVRSLAVVGTAKNVGKTVTMNYLAAELSARGLTVGFISSGRDGETIDSFTGEPKPSVVPPEGSWVATAEGVLVDTGASLEIVDVQERPGLLGRLVLGRVIEPSPIELVGPTGAKELKAVAASLLLYGADIVLVDGALDRIAAASPLVTEGLILATGASAHDNPRTIAQETAALAWTWLRPIPPDPKVVELAGEAVKKGRVAFLDRGPSGPHPTYSARVSRYGTVLGMEEQVLAEAGNAAYVAIPGAVTSKFLSLASSWPEQKGLAVIARDAASVFSRGDPGVPLYVLHSANLLAITVNPVSYRGISLDPKQLVMSVHRAVLKTVGTDIPVFDVVSGIRSPKGESSLAMG